MVGWREFSHGRARSAWRAEENRLVLARKQALDEITETALKLADNAEAKARLEAERQGLVDRAGNLAVQRDHLRAEVDRLLVRLREAEAAGESLRTGLETARLETLEARRRPSELEAELQAARARSADLESRIDELAREAGGQPSQVEITGLSSDQTVFALAGSWKRDTPLPARVLLCRANRILLEGWIHRQEGNELIGHTGRRQSPASALVKGEKVFILPVNSHEADY